MSEHLRKIIDGNSTAAVQMLKEKGVRVLHRFGDTLVVEGESVPELPGDMPGATRAIPTEALAEAPAGMRDEDIGLLAYRVRRSEAYRRSKLHRSDEGEDWGVIFNRM